MPSEFVVCDKGVWIYKEREFRFEVPYHYEPQLLERFLLLLERLLSVFSEEGYLKQIAGIMGDGKLLLLRASLGPGESLNCPAYSLSTKFSSYKDLSFINSVEENFGSKIFTGIQPLLALRQVGIVFEALDLGIRFYSSKSSISKWFRVPIEEGSLEVSISTSEIKCKATLRKSCDEKNLQVVRDVINMLAEFVGIDVGGLGRYWDLGRPL